MFDQTTETDSAPLSVPEMPPTRTKRRGRLLFVLHGEGSCPGHVGQALARKGYLIERRKPRFGCPLPQSLDSYDGIVVFGGPMSCNDPDPWIKAEIDLADRALTEGKPYLGICLGAQMLARALGADVAPHPDRQVEVGYYRVEPTPAGRALGSWPGYFYHWHREGFSLPAGASLLAKSDGAFPHQAYAYNRAVGLQFHPEITYALVNRWTTDANDMLAEPGAQPAAAHRLDHLRHQRAVNQWLDRFLDRWLIGHHFATAT